MPEFTIVHATRLLDVARSARECPFPEAFTMSYYAHFGVAETGHPCGTPACALGGYAARLDLQDACKIVPTNGGPGMRVEFSEEKFPDIKSRSDRFGYDCRAAREWFGVSAYDLFLLFSSNGCNGAKTPLEAAKYIETFAARKFEAQMSEQHAKLSEQIRAVKQAKPAAVLATEPYPGDGRFSA